MKSRIVFFALATTLAMALNSYASFQDPDNTSEKPLYHVVGNEGSVVGTITVSGELLPAKKIDMSADPACLQLTNEPTVDALLTNAGKLQNAFVYIKEGDALNTYRFEEPDSDAVLAHKNCQFSPHVLGLRVRQPFMIVNADPTTHNTHAIPRNNPEWNLSLAPGAPPFPKFFRRPELLIPVKDNQHPWERAYIGVVDHPFFAVTDEQGNYEIRGLPPGKYKLVIWHEMLGEQEIELTLQANESRKLDAMFDGAKANDKRNSSSTVLLPD